MIPRLSVGNEQKVGLDAVVGSGELDQERGGEHLAVARILQNPHQGRLQPLRNPLVPGHGRGRHVQAPPDELVAVAVVRHPQHILPRLRCLLGLHGGHINHISPLSGARTCAFWLYADSRRVEAPRALLRRGELGQRDRRMSCSRTLTSWGGCRWVGWGVGDVGQVLFPQAYGLPFP